MTISSPKGYQNQNCHFEQHGARNYVYFGVRFPGTPSYSSIFNRVPLQHQTLQLTPLPLSGNDKGLVFINPASFLLSRPYHQQRENKFSHVSPEAPTPGNAPLSSTSPRHRASHACGQGCYSSLLHKPGRRQEASS